jgi:hypothetical protein
MDLLGTSTGATNWFSTTGFGITFGATGALREAGAAAAGPGPPSARRRRPSPRRRIRQLVGRQQRHDDDHRRNHHVEGEGDRMVLDCWVL